MVNKLLSKIITKIILCASEGSLFFSDIFKETKFRNSLLRKLGMEIGSPVIIDKNFTFWDPTTIKIGNNVLIRENCYFDHDIKVEDFCTFSRDVMILTAEHNPVDMSYIMKPVLIKKGAWVGARATILPGVTIGEYAVVAAGAVVNNDVLPRCLVGGVPAKVIRQLDYPTKYYNQFKEIVIKQNSNY